MIMRALLAILALATIVLATPAETGSTMIPDFAPGQEWSIKSASPTTAKVVIGRLETWQHGKIIVHVSIIDVPIPRGVAGAGATTSIGHMPFDKTALAASADRLLSSYVPPAPGFESGYEQWKSAKGGVFTISAEKAIEIVVQTLIDNQHNGR
jgi:hypothetical protein